MYNYKPITVTRMPFFPLLKLGEKSEKPLTVCDKRSVNDDPYYKDTVVINI